MTIRTQAELQDFLNSELAWRKKELTTLKFSLDRCQSDERATFTRAAICLLYAHWEGFIKAAAKAYVEFVAHRRLPFRELGFNFVALGLKSEFATAGVSKRIRDYTTITTTLLTKLDQIPKIPVDESIDTRSNLSSEVLSGILDVLGFESSHSSHYTLKKAIIDKKLLWCRNNVAHGEYYPIESGDYNDLHGEVIKLLERFRNDIEDHATAKKYRRVSA